VIGLDNVFVATNSEFDDFISELKSHQFFEPPMVKVIESNQVVKAGKNNSGQLGFYS